MKYKYIQFRKQSLKILFHSICLHRLSMYIGTSYTGVKDLEGIAQDLEDIAMVLCYVIKGMFYF